MSDYLFSYGTLRPGMAPRQIAPTVNKLISIGEGFVRGTLYDLGRYPGALLDPNSDRKIFGTMYLLPDDPAILRKLDEYEGFDPSAPESSLFVRILSNAILDDGRTLPCWIYEFNGSPDSSQVLAKGEYKPKRNA